jgi:hypothetical protein
MNRCGKGGPTDLGEARRLFRLAAEQGHVHAQFNLALMNFEGEGGPMDPVEALRQIRLAAKNGAPMAHSWLETRASLYADALLAEEEKKATSQKAKSKSSKKKKDRRTKGHTPALACIGESNDVPPSPEVEPTASSVRALKDAGSITGRHDAPESTNGGETTCIVCFSNVKSHIAVPCFHQCVCGPCSKKMDKCPICRASVNVWGKVCVA